MVIPIGQSLGLWTVLADAGRNRHHHQEVEVRCQCGFVAHRELITLRHGRSRACHSCAGIEHGHAVDGKQTAEYRIWHSMKKRCYTSSSTGYAYYGGTGITVCDRWRESFEAFLADVGSRPSIQHSLDRFPNPFGNYEAGNVRWATRSQQQQNRRDQARIQGCVHNW